MPASRFLSCLLVGGLLLAATPGCSLFRPYKPKPKQNVDPRSKLGGETQFVGTITLVNEDAGFVLIDSGNLPSPPVGRTVKSRVGTTEAVELRVTDVRRRPFVVADIVQGVPQKGEQVFQAPQ